MADKDVRLILALERLLQDSSSSILPKQAQQALNKKNVLFLELLEKASIPENGWNDDTIEHTLYKLASMDANNNSDSCGVGEREGRIYSTLVRKRHYGFAHGVGRSGNICEIQPKAPGSAILQKLCDRLTRHALRIAGLRCKALTSVHVYPLATGMALAMVLRTLSHSRPGAKYVLMPRIDQKSCIKCVNLAGLKLVIIPNKISGYEVTTDGEALKQVVTKLGPENIVAVVTVSSCFAPRVCDDLVMVADLCRVNHVPHLVNNAYGLQSNQALHKLNEAIRAGRVDAVVQSTDKNFMVPVGGSIIVACKELGDKTAKMYAGRANISPLIDLFVTLLSMGVSGYQSLLSERRDCFEYFRQRLSELSPRILATPHNDISIAIEITPSEGTKLGSQLFVRAVSGARAIVPSGMRSIEGHEMKNFGAHHDDYPHSYLTVASAVGQTRDEVDTFIKRLTKLIKVGSAKLD